ncbi:MAG: aminotransferase class I/II-fold pyridoxal phosphate-dependent enzyme [Acholeplasmatales bacterium]|nr:aminotransferase class I/II-fold pyridoxal phosphate-dependent enzyme [Acholeplasmatales bacterium]
MYSFDEIAQRRYTDSYKWDVKPCELPMWVADMDFKVDERIKDSIIKRAEIMAYGYSNVPDSFYEAYRDFFLARHDLDLKCEWMIFSTGVVPSISSIVRSTTSLDDNVLILSPVYNIFFNSIRNNHRNILVSDLIYKDYKYEIDWADLESKMKDPKTSLMIFCNPHNPCGNIWSLEELQRLVDMAVRYNVIIISDEIHCDITTPGVKYNPMFKVAGGEKNVIMLASASKCYNLAGLHASVAIVRDKKLRYTVWRGINTDECGENDFFCADAHSTALLDCRDWLDAMNLYVYNNKKYLEDYINNNLPCLKLVHSDSLYLSWIDIKALNMDSDEFTILLRKKTGLYISSGKAYGDNGNGFVRINLATSLANVKDACERLRVAISLLK